MFRLRNWTDAFGDRVAWTLTTDELTAAAQAMLDHGYAPGSVNRDIGAIGSMYKWVIQQRRAPAGFTSPTLNIRRFTESVRVVDIPADALSRIKDIVLVRRDRRFAVFVHLLLDTGARKSELLERCWADVYLDKRRIRLTDADTKTGKGRVLFFSEATAALIRRVAPHRPPTALLFPGRGPTLPINYKDRLADPDR